MSFTRRGARAKKKIRSVKIGGVCVERTPLQKDRALAPKPIPMFLVTGLRTAHVSETRPPMMTGPITTLSAKLLPFKWHEYKEFDKLSNQACSQNQMERIRGRLALDKFQKTVGPVVYEALCEYIIRRDIAKREGL